ncbi:hypothetical protein AN618_24290 [Fervidicola ferrireducens]|uniref:PAS domain-containing protein n=1 Tax=Fervidicola ferrireducens TaxID=520764 RepID=A0A140L0C7_9FIRM|nr:PAS domain-containing protein [Fervidicola ferrireducens]KXG74002.1 hypothetical protein AN618_24290 [Fervidicola ferrireducens]
MVDGEKVHIERKNKSFIEESRESIAYLKKREEFLSRIFENEQMLIVVWALDGRIVWFNRYTQAVIGIAEILGKGGNEGPTLSIFSFFL